VDVPGWLKRLMSSMRSTPNLPTRTWQWPWCVLLVAASAAAGGFARASEPRPLDMTLPTANRALLDGRPEDFFMGVERRGEGDKARLVWQGGQFGFVRSPMEWEGGTLCTQFHEGIDIAPIEFDGSGKPRDIVRAISAGRVVRCHATPQGSAYGNHVVIEHDWGCGPVYSLYAHLDRVDVCVEEKVERGASLGMLGNTGTGIEARRAHLHLEINLLLDDDFDPRRWPLRSPPAPEGKFDRLNVAGIDPAALFVAVKEDPSMTLPRYIAGLKPYYVLAVPQHGEIDFLRRYPWLGPDKPIPTAPAWEISFTAWGLPVKFAPLQRTVAEPEVTWVEPFAGKHAWRTGGLLSGSGPTAVPTPRGLLRTQATLGDTKR
jgi:murein DD-endopeptidase MepM/ murein hydrolase activator NlpD